MSKFLIIPAVAFMGLVACNSGADTSTAKADSTGAPAADTSMHHDMAAMANAEGVPPIPEGAKVYFKNLKDGETVTSPVKIEMGADGIAVDTAGKIVPGKGHHHLLVDAGDSTAAGTVVMKDSTHIHFGKGQTETTLPLTPGKHKLTLQFADGIHRSYGSKLTSTITVDVKK